MEQNSLTAHKYFTGASEKFDYFISAIITATLAYLGQQASFSPIGFNVSTINLLSIIIFAISGFASFKRIETSIIHHRLNYEYLKFTEENCIELADKNSSGMYVVARNAAFWYRIRNICLLMGFLSYIVAKLLYAYTTNAT